MCYHRPELSHVIGLKGCVKGFQFQKKDFNLLEEPGTIGISSGCPEESFVSGPSTTFQAITINDGIQMSHIELQLNIGEYIRWSSVSKGLI